MTDTYTDKNGTAYCAEHGRWIGYPDGRSRRCPECPSVPRCLRVSHAEVMAVVRARGGGRPKGKDQ